MRTNVEIDDELMKKAMKASGTTTKKAAVQAGLEMLVRLKGQARMRELRGKIHWDGDLKAMRPGYFSPDE